MAVSPCRPIRVCSEKLPRSYANTRTSGLECNQAVRTPRPRVGDGSSCPALPVLGARLGRQAQSEFENGSVYRQVWWTYLVYKEYTLDYPDGLKPRLVIM